MFQPKLICLFLLLMLFSSTYSSSSFVPVKIDDETTVQWRKLTGINFVAKYQYPTPWYRHFEVRFKTCPRSRKRMLRAARRILVKKYDVKQKELPDIAIIILIIRRSKVSEACRVTFYAAKYKTPF